MSTDSATGQAPTPDADEHGRVYGHQIAPLPPISPSADLDLAALVRHHLAKAQGFWVGMTGMDSVGEESATPSVEHTDYMAIGLRQLEQALLLAELEEGTSLDVALVLVHAWLDDGEFAASKLFAHGSRRGIYMPGIRPYPTRRALAERRAREKHPHRIVPTLDGNGHGVTWEAFCDAGPEAWCRATFDCDCETVGQVQRRSDGRWAHDPQRDRADGEPETWHVMEPGGRCHQLDFLNADQSLLPEAYTGGNTPARAGRIVLTWEGEDYSWDYADEATS